VSKKRTFEEDLARLEDLVARLEDGELDLEESLEAFEEGMKLAGELTKALDKAQERVRKLVRGRQGELGLREFDSPDDEQDD